MKTRFIPVPSMDFSDVLETALRRIVETNRLAEWTNDNCDYADYERAAQARDRAIEAAGELIGQIDDKRRPSRTFSRSSVSIQRNQQG